jgi:hypothetical protein
MATTLKLIVEESEEIQANLASFLLQKARKEEKVCHFSFLHIYNVDLCCVGKKRDSVELILCSIFPGDISSIF